MKHDDLRKRTRQLALRIIRLYGALSKSVEAQVLGKQVLRSGTSVGAHYREAYRARSNAEFVSKSEVALQELDETSYWLELLVESHLMPERRLAELISETDQLNAIYVTCVRKAKTAKRSS